MSTPLTSRVSIGLRQFMAWCVQGGLRPQPVYRWEWFWMRLSFALLTGYTFLNFNSHAYTSTPAPNGLARVMDLGFLSHPWAPWTVLVLAWLGLLGYVANRWVPVTLGVATLCHVLPHTLANSQGAINHTHQLVSLLLLAQWIVSLVAWLRSGKIDGQSWTGYDGRTRDDLMCYYSKATLVGVYVIAAFAKIYNSRGLWILNSRYIPIELIKGTDQSYYSTLEQPPGDGLVMAEWLVAHPWLTTALFSSGFFLELAAFLALRDRLWAACFGLALIALHRGILLLFNLEFFQFEWANLIFLVNLPFWIHLWASRSRASNALTPE